MRFGGEDYPREELASLGTSFHDSRELRHRLRDELPLAHVQVVAAAGDAEDVYARTMDFEIAA